VHSNFQTYRFAIIVTLVCSLLLASAATFLKPRQQENIALDIRRNILKAAGITSPDKEYTRSEIQQLYDENISALVLNSDGEIQQGMSPAEIDPKKDSGLLPLYEWVVGDDIKSYVIPISGKGLWSTLYGYLAVEPDGATIRGITFYQHGETPGLGGEIEKQWFTDMFIGKKFVDDEGNLVSVTIVRGKVQDTIPEDEQYHYVDGISGATLTGRGINKFLKEDLKSYEPFFQNLRSSEKGDIHG
jgi:Na+-transporting NADH:ubiquinone oxidoreductase subunit C